jgi:hypothetical protein
MAGLVPAADAETRRQSCPRRVALHHRLRRQRARLTPLRGCETKAPERPAVMAGLVPATHVEMLRRSLEMPPSRRSVDARRKAGMTR